LKLQVKKYYLSILFLFICAFASAQTSFKTEERELYFNIYYAYRVNDTMIVFIEGARDLGIKKGNLINAFQTYSNAKNAAGQNRKFKTVGAGKIVKADSLIAAMVKLNKKEDTLAAGDLISIKINIPLVEYRSIFSELAFNKILFTNLYKESFYALPDILYTDNKQREDSLYAIMLKDLHDTYISMKDREDVREAVSQKIKGGRYIGKTYLEMLRDAKREDIESFLLFVSAFTDNYRGKNFKLNETIVTWALNNAPYSPGEIKRALFPVYKNKEAFLKLLPIYKKDIVDDNHCFLFIKDVEKLIGSGKLTEASAYNDFIKTIAYAVNDTSGKSLTWLLQSEINHKQDKYEIAVTQCDSAIKYALMANQHEYELAAISKKIYCLNKLLEFTKAKSLIQEFEKKLTAYKSTLLESVYNSNWQKRYEYEGAMYYAEGNYDLALKSYESLIELNKGINSFESLIHNADYFAFIGRVNNDQGKPSAALDALASAAKTYWSNYDTLNSAKVQNDMAYSYYKLANYSKCMAVADSAMRKLLLINDFNNAGYSKSLQGSCYWELGKYDSAVIAHKQSIALRRKSNNLSGQAFSWKQIGELYLLSGMKNDALVAYDSAANFYRLVKDNSGLAETYNKKGKVYQNDENYKKAVEFYEKASGVDNKSTVESLYNLGNAWLELDTARAGHYFSLCLKKSDSTGNTYYQFFATKALTGLAYRAYNFRQGDKLLEKCILLSKQINTPETYAYCHELKALKYYNMSELDSALFYYRLALQAFDTVSKDNAIWELNSIANVYISSGDFSMAEESYAKAISIAGLASNNLALGYSLQSASFLYGLLGEFSKGIKANDSAIFIFNRSGNKLRLANTYAARGTLLKSMGNFKESINSFLFADSIYREELTNDYRSTVQNNIGVTYYNQADYKKAIKYFESALTYLKTDLINEEYLLFKSNIAECLYYLKNTKEAERIFLEVFPIAKKKNFNRISSGMAITLGKIYYDAGQYQKAFGFFEEAREYGIKSSEKEKIIDANIYLAKIDQQSGKTKSAENNLSQAVAVARTYRVPNGWEAFYELGLFYFNQKNLDSAVVNFKSAIELVEEISGNIYGGEEAQKIYRNDPRKFDLYSKIVSSLAEKGNVDDAWVYANRSNITGIKELLGNLPSQSGDLKKNKAIDEANLLFQQQNALDKKINELQSKSDKERSNPQLQSLLEEREIAGAKYLKYLEQLKIKYPDLRAYFSENVNPEQFKNYKGLLPDDAAVVLYIVNDNKLLIFTVTNENTAIHISELKEDISATIKQFTGLLKTPGKSSKTGPLHLRSEIDDEDAAPSASFTTVAGNLYSLLIGNIRDKISSKKKLCIIPNGDLSNIPFQCLGQIMPDSSFRFLVEDYSIFYTNQLDVFKNREPQKESISSFAAFGVPDKTLHFTQHEAESIVSILKLNIPAFVNKAATEKTAKDNLSEKRFVHFATHGILNYTDYSQSYLKFLPDKDTTDGNNGQLTIDEIKALDISGCELVTLSACETAVNKVLAKGWQISPANSFLLNRVKSVVATLWKVDDQATSILMEAFYSNLNKQMDKVDALRQAQVTLSRDPRFSHPYYWGAFVLFGDWR